MFYESIYRNLYNFTKRCAKTLKWVTGGGIFIFIFYFTATNYYYLVMFHACINHAGVEKCLDINLVKRQYLSVLRLWNLRVYQLQNIRKKQKHSRRKSTQDPFDCDSITR